MKLVKRKKKLACLIIVFLAFAVEIVAIVNYSKGLIFSSLSDFCKFNVLNLLLMGLGLFRYISEIEFFTNKVIDFVYPIILAIAVTHMIEIMCYQPRASIKYGLFILNALFILILVYGLILLFGNHVVSYIFILVSGWIFAAICHYVYVFKGVPISPGDFIAYRTGLSVAGGYEFELSNDLLYGTELLLWGTTFLLVFTPKTFKSYEKKRPIFITVGLAYYFLFALLFSNISIMEITGIDVAGWERTDIIQKSGVVISLAEETQRLKPDKPQNYSEQSARELLVQDENDEVETTNNDILPNIVVVMNESFSDLSVLGEFQSEEYMPYFNGINDYIQKGYVYSSVMGGGTCNSEYEFVTGNSAAFVTGYPYMQYNFANSNNIIKLLNEYGYQSVFFHPASIEAWNRRDVYGMMGINKCYSWEDVNNQIEWETVNGFLSDKKNYEFVDFLFNGLDSPFFIFNVTMQNHGGYNIEALEDNVERITMGDEYSGFPETQAYLSLMRESDKAIEELMTFLRKQNEPTLLLVFGDHQPYLYDGFKDYITSPDGSIEKTESYYMTPYIIWTNYDTGTKKIEKDISINYLGENLLQYTGIDNEYLRYLRGLEKDIPVINALGYKTADGNWHSLDEENDQLEKYRMVQYYELFDYSPEG
ncbi:Phosphoglycerol transferase MdoB [Butyrivibrio sp. ob235]|uniref:LTA synthase family protein n=1 Tax=Butyrivibrio sp. ob235 TaxID=1761780 RepID=UPI0008D5BE17|nr:LTA synthase family protein [Butyrivibrio sp. ob235]SEL97756.1 Phosphoglycerol transferase MdoB [Butyrivibrio sp. ob235]